MKYGGADAHERGGGENRRVAGGQCKSQQASQCDAHANRQGIRLWPAVGIETDERLEDRGRQLQSERDQAHLAKIKMEGVLEQRIDRRDQRLQRVV